MANAHDGYQALCANCRAEVGPPLDFLPRAKLSVNDRGDLIMRTQGTSACVACGTTEIEIQVAPAATPAVARARRPSMWSGHRSR